MFFVFNKKKINSYLISLGTVAILFGISLIATNNINNTIETSTTIENLPITKIQTERKTVAISINCSENAENIDSILDSLSKMKAKATFYVTGDFVTNYPDSVKKIVSNGNEVGNLSNEYCHLKDKSEEVVKNQIVECTKKIESITETNVKTFRAPYGEYNSVVIEQAQSQNLTPIQWNIDSLDYNGLNGEEMWERINENLSSGSIILMHNSAKNTASSLEDIIHNIQEKGYELTTVSDLIFSNQQSNSN